MRKGIGGHQSAAMGNDEWLTPRDIITALGPFDLDPCSPINRPWDTADVHYSKLDEGLSKTWFGRVWLNPPYGRETGRWLAKLRQHRNGIALVFARTETRMFFENVWGQADAVMFLFGRLHFHHVDGSRSTLNAGAPSCLIAYGFENRAVLKRAVARGDIHGHVVNAR